MLGKKKNLVLFLYLSLNYVSRFFILHLLLQFEFLIDGKLVFCETPFVIFSSLSMSVLVKVSYDYDTHIFNILCLKDS